MRRTYNEILEMVPKVALMPRFARRVVGKALLRGGKLRPGFIQFFSPRELLPPYAPTLARGASEIPVTRRVQMNIPVAGTLPKSPYPDSYLDTQFVPNVVTMFEKGVGSNGAYASPQMNFDVFHFSHYSQNARPLVGSVVNVGDFNGTTNPPGWVAPPYEEFGMPYVSGSRDPFPWGEEAPLYFQADLTECDFFDWFVRFESLSTPFSQFQSEAYGRWGAVSPAYRDVNVNGVMGWQKLDKILLRCKCSFDGGQTWEAPFYRVGDSEPRFIDTTQYSLVSGRTRLPSFTYPPYVNEEAKWGTVWVNAPRLSVNSGTNWGPTFVSGQWYGVPVQPGYLELPGSPNSTGAVTSSIRLPRKRLFEHDDVIFKITLEAPENAYIQFTSCGIMYGNGERDWSPSQL